ncbi:MAG: apolipoprotein N-acyltransferase [Candidatus Omnitrophota bacterium]|jgi:apolipoprotein N-acyltransferase
MSHTLSRYFRLQDHFFLLSALSAALLILSFPGVSWGALGWIALVPFLMLVHSGIPGGRAAFCAFLTGVLFFGISLHWFLHVHFWAWFGVTVIESAFFALFGWMAYEAGRFKSPLLRIALTASAWTAVELLRSEIPIFGLGWNLLAFTQSGSHSVLQFAEIAGAYGLGFVMAAVNASGVEILNALRWILASFSKSEDDGELTQPLGWDRAKKVAGIMVLLIAIGLVFFLLLTFGRTRLETSEPYAKTVRISVIQGNIPQELKWNTAVREKILEVYTKLTQLAQYDQPDLAVWPEASFPGYLNRDALSPVVMNLAASLQLPLLVGSCHLEGLDQAYNSAYLVDGLGEIRDRYDKQYLVPFGEYVPLKSVFGWLQPVADDLGISDFRRGMAPRVLKMPNEESRFSVLICFEDVFANLARQAVDLGAEWLVVITNDAWFGPTAAAHQHLQASVFRAVENGVPVVRAANTGISAFISSRGIVSNRVKDRQGRDTFVTGKQTAAIQLSDRTTLYRRGGWMFPYWAAGFALLLIVIRKIYCL